MRSRFGLCCLLGLAAWAMGCSARTKALSDFPHGSGATPAERPAPIAASATARTIKVPSSVCSFPETSALPAARADGSIDVPATHPFISYSGRVDCGNPEAPLPRAPTLGFVGSSVHVRFVGTGLELKLRDHGRGTPQTTNYYDVSVDGAAPRLLEVSAAQQRYTLAADLPQGEHQVELFKRVEAAPGGNVGAGLAEVLGFVLHGTGLLPGLLPKRRLEFVGDSITCGYGNELETTNPANAHYTTRASNGHQAYGALTAALLGAQYSAVAYSGRGVSRNYAGSGGQLLPELYFSSVPEDPAASAWRPAQYAPDAVIVNLGTNDFSTPGVDRALFVDNYVAFLTTLRSHYPNAALVAAIGPMLNDSYPPGANAWSHAQADVRAAVETRRAAGDRNAHVVVFAPQTPPYGEDWHPSLATHRRMAEQLGQVLEDILDW